MVRIILYLFIVTNVKDIIMKVTKMAGLMVTMSVYLAVLIVCLLIISLSGCHECCIYNCRMTNNTMSVYSLMNKLAPVPVGTIAKTVSNTVASQPQLNA